MKNASQKSKIAAIAGFAAAAAVGAAALVGLPRAAQACGGLFCNARPVDPFAPLPVAQTGENVVFAIDKDPAGGATTLVAHIQILYAGDAAKFSWVVPVDAAPELSVGTDRLFSLLGTLTQPRFTSQQEVEGQCIPQPGPPAFDAGVRGNASSGSGGTSGAGGASAGGPGVMVSFQGEVGPYDAAVIRSDDAMALKMWLTENGYIVSDQASGLIDGYVRDGKFFVALKLLNGAGVRSIQPIVLTFKGIEPCVPLRLTAIAANNDMQVRMWVLADHRAVPKNFYELKIDDARINWQNGGDNYNALVTEAANDAGGKAFVTEYAGSSSIAARALWSEGQFNLSSLQAAMTPPAYVQALVGSGLSNDPQTLPLLTKYIPMPEAVRAMGITDAQFYQNINLYWSQYTFPAFDLPALTTEINAKIIEPRRLAQAMLDRHPYLTRLNTFISPEEMTVDPLFIINKDLPNVPLLRTAIFRTMCGNMQFMACNAPVRLEFPDGRMAWVRTGTVGTTCTSRPYDLSKLQELPAAETVWQREDVGEGIRIQDNSAEIRAGLLQNNSAFPAEQKMFPIPAQGPAPVTDPTPTPTTPDSLTPSKASGCACAVGKGGSTSAAALLSSILLAGTLGLLVARRRRGSSRQRKPRGHTP